MKTALEDKNKKFRSALDEAIEMHKSNTEIPKRFVKALYYSQLLEFYLESILNTCITIVKRKVKNKYITYSPKIEPSPTANWYLNRIETFLPREKYKELFRIVTYAIEKRNDFIHNSFRKINKDGKEISLDIENVHLDAESNKKMNEWIEAFLTAGKYLVPLMIGIQRSEM